MLLPCGETSQVTWLRLEKQRIQISKNVLKFLKTRGN